MNKVLLLFFIIVLAGVLAEAIYAFYVIPSRNGQPLTITSVLAKPSPPLPPTFAPEADNPIPSILAFEKKLKKEGSLISVQHEGKKRIIVYKFILTEFDLHSSTVQENGKSQSAQEAWFYYLSPAGNAHETNFPLYGPLNIFQIINGEKVTLSPTDIKAGDTVLVTVTVDTSKHLVGSVNTEVQKL